MVTQQLLGVAAVLAWLAAVLLTALAVRRRWPQQKEWSRKVVHIGTGAVVLLAWALETASCRQWDPELTQRSVMNAWMERAEAIRQWQLCLRSEPGETQLVTGLGTQRDWEQRCEAMLRA